MNLNYKKNERHSSRAEWGHNATRVSLMGVVTCCHVSRYKPLLTTGFGKWKTDTFGTRYTPPRCRPVASQWPMVTGKSPVRISTTWESAWPAVLAQSLDISTMHCSFWSWNRLKTHATKATTVLDPASYWLVPASNQ